MRDAATTVERAARSILDSTLCKLELIIVDDGSADDSAAIVRQINDPRLRLIQQDALGVCAAANRGTAEATAPVIAPSTFSERLIISFRHRTRAPQWMPMRIWRSCFTVGPPPRIGPRRLAPSRNRPLPHRKPAGAPSGPCRQPALEAAQEKVLARNRAKALSTAQKRERGIARGQRGWPIVY